MPALPAGIDVILQRAGAKDPADRFPNMGMLLEAIDNLFQTAPVSLSQASAERAVTAELSVAEVQASENPYRGLYAFTEANAADFFGRESFVQEILNMLADETDLQRFVAVVGPSGSGKSSVVKAGLLPAIRHGGLPKSQQWYVVDFTPGGQPWEEMAAALQRVSPVPVEDISTILAGSRNGLLTVVERILPEDPETELVLVIDQFEELFTLVADEEVRVEFLQSLVTAVLDPGSRLRIVLTMRADFLDRPLQYVDFGDLLGQRLAFVLPLTPDELARAIARPVEQLGMGMEPELVATITREVGDQPGMLPLLQYALTELFNQREGPLLTMAQYQRTNGVRGALTQRADDIYKNLDDAGRAAVRQLFLRLITLGEGAEDTRRRVLRTELEALPPPAEFALSAEQWRHRQRNVISSYGRYRLLTFDHDPATRVPTIEVAHEALLREWSRLRGWLQESREDLRRQRELSLATGNWQNSGQDESYLLRGSRLSNFAEWMDTTTVAVTSAEAGYLQAGLRARDARISAEEDRRQRELETVRRLAEEQSRRAQEQARAAGRLRLFAVGLAALLIVAAGFAWFANDQRIENQQNFLNSERIRLASQAENALERGEGAEVAALLAIRSLQLGYSPEADMALQEALHFGLSLRQYAGHVGELRGTMFTEDGRKLLTSATDNLVRLWDVQTGQELVQFSGHESIVNMSNISPDEQMLATISSDGTARIWDAESGQELQRFTGLDGNGWSVSFTPDNQRLITTDTRSVKLWDIETGMLVEEFVGHLDAIYFHAISADGTLLATVGNDSTARIWEIRSGEEIQQVVVNEGWLGGVDFSPDGRYLLTTGEDGVARIWDIPSGRMLRRMVGHLSELYDGEFSPDGRYVATTGYDGTARIWDVATGTQLQVLRGHTNTLGEVNWSADGRLLVTGSADTTARLWDVWAEREPLDLLRVGGAHTQTQTVLKISDDGELTVVGRDQGDVEIWHNGRAEKSFVLQVPNSDIRDAIISADNRYVAVAASDGRVRLWDLERDAVTVEFSGHDGPVWRLAWGSQTGGLISAGEDGTIRIWDIATGVEQQQLSGHTAAVRSLAVAGDGRYLLSGGADGSIRYWDLQTGMQKMELFLPDVTTHALVFTPGERGFYSSGDDHLIRYWDLESGQSVQQFAGHTDVVQVLDVSSDGALLLSGSDDQTVRVWDQETGTELRRLGLHSGSIFFARFSADDQQVYSGTLGDVFVWRTSLADTMQFACAQLWRDFTPEEREFYIIDQSPACANDSGEMIAAAPTWTPIAATPQPVDAVRTEIGMEFIALDVMNMQMDLPFQHVFFETTEGVVRPSGVDETQYDLPLYYTVEGIPDDFIDPPFDVGPFPKGGPLGFSLGEWLAAVGQGTYIQKGAQADIDIQFTNLVPDGVYTLWCVTLEFPSFATIEELPCGAADGSENTFVADAGGNGRIQLTMDAFPPSTAQVIYEIAVAYHSDGFTYGPLLGERGKNAHVQLVYDFFPPE